MVSVPLRHVGGLDVYDIVGICEPNGFGGLPFPFWQHENRWPLKTLVQVSETVSSLEDGSLRSLAPWVETYRQADIWVACRVEPCARGAVDKRLVAHRKGDTGFVASQRAGTDGVEVFELDARTLGSAIAESVGLERPGSRPSIQIPGYLDNFIDELASRDSSETDDDEFDNFGFTTQVVQSHGRGTRITDYDQVIAMGTFQSRCDPATSWGIDWAKTVVVWVRIKGDGDYVFSADLKTATPVTVQRLAERFDQAIAEDVAAVRIRRGLS